ncbi:MAG: UTP--glucose-1-phosphate uridylyltransferase GalU [Candidatus Competibacteraceae bacterium]|nr:UTP--glucose-1-phosphate uridylyltransferase GalU [Candidatus Competibacteraceae bacterium]MCP5124757.1 UTP--glucose-1-phosphate uridylyltransferase GalU [Gammaproteobacteria bacterium]
MSWNKTISEVDAVKRQVRKAVFPVAGLGTRFLPATKASPKEMLPIVDKPLIQYAVEEAVAAGVDTLVFIIGRTKNAIADHFDKAYELEAELEARQKTDLLKVVRGIVPSGVECVYIRQAEALGLGHAVLCARPAVGEEPFAVILADDLIEEDQVEGGVMSQMTRHFNKYQCSILGVERVPIAESDKYGIVHPLPFATRLSNVDSIIEKPKPENAPSNLAVVGRYILTSRIFDLLTNIPRGAGNEIQLTDGIAALLSEEQVLAYEFTGRRHDCGNKLGYLVATVEYGLRHPELGEQFRNYLQSHGCRFGDTAPAASPSNSDPSSLREEVDADPL